MTALLGRVQAQNETWFRKLDGPRFRGVMLPVSPTALPTSVFIMPRIALRVRPAEPVETRDLFYDPWGRVLLVGDHDATLSGDARISRVLALFQMTHRVSWSRQVGAKNPITGLPESLGKPSEMGPIWCSIENYTRGDNDAGLRITTDRRRCVTGVELQLGDGVGTRTVKRVDRALGVSVAEIE